MYDSDPAVATRVFRYCPALWQAVERGTPAVIDLLVTAGADLRQLDLNGETLLHKACGQSSENLRYLIMAGLDVNQTKPGAEAPLHYAAVGDHLDCARVLLEHGADPNIVDGSGQTPLDYIEDPTGPVFGLIRTFGGKRANELQREESR